MNRHVRYLLAGVPRLGLGLVVLGALFGVVFLIASAPLPVVLALTAVVVAYVLGWDAVTNGRRGSRSPRGPTDVVDDSTPEPVDLRGRLPGPWLPPHGGGYTPDPSPRPRKPPPSAPPGRAGPPTG